MRASVIIVTYNHRSHIERCLRSLLPTLSHDDEVIVIDNASSDDTAEVVSQSFPQVRLIRSDVNHGYGGGNNLGASLSQAGYLAFLNPDTEPRSGWLDALIDCLEATPNAGLATAKILLSSAPGLIDAFGHTVHISGIATCQAWGQPSETHTDVEEVAAVSGACFAVRRELFAGLGGFDERLFLYYEDDELSLRARLAGYACLAVPASIVLHDHAPGISAHKLRYLERNRWWTTLKVYDPLTLVALTPVLAAAELLAWAFAVRSGTQHVLAKARAGLELIAWLPDLPSARRAMPHAARSRTLLRLHGTRLSFAQVTSGRAVSVAESVTARAFQVGRRLVMLAGSRI